MPSSRNFIQGLRRMSASTILRRPSKGDVQHIEDIGVLSHGNHAAGSISKVDILTLPTELLAQIVERLPFRDLCALRLVSRTTNMLLSEGDIIRRWTTCTISASQRALYHHSSSVPNTMSMRYALEQHRRRLIAFRLATRYAHYVEREVLRYTLRRRDPSLDDKTLHETFRRRG